MPCSESYDYDRQREQKRKRIERILKAKGLDPRSQKFQHVLWRRMRRP
jgi:hypothetical protein